MKKNIFTIITVMLAVYSMFSCSDGEDTTASNADINRFAPSSTDMSPTAQLERDFYEKVGSYLLFNDTLIHEKTGCDIYGNAVYHTELLELGYNMVGKSGGYDYSFKYITDYAEQKKAVELLESKLVPKLGKTKPFSILLADSITMWTWNHGVRKIVKKSSSDTDPHPTIVLGTRCYAISLNGGEFNDSADNYVGDIMQKVIVDRLKRLSDSDLSVFYAFSKDYYAQDETNFGLSNDNDADSLMWKFGFFSDTYDDYFIYKGDDLSNWEKVVATYSMSRFKDKYGSSDMMMNKFKALRAIVEKQGIKLDN